jgi:uncharacterized membrane-anchored protein
VDNYGVALETTTIAFSIALAITFSVWHRSERTLSIHTIFTTRREAFWIAAVAVAHFRFGLLTITKRDAPRERRERREPEFEPAPA